MHPVLSSYRVPNAVKLTVYGLFQREVKPTIRVIKKNSCVVDPSRSELIRPDPTRTGLVKTVNDQKSKWRVNGPFLRGIKPTIR